MPRKQCDNEGCERLVNCGANQCWACRSRTETGKEEHRIIARQSAARKAARERELARELKAQEATLNGLFPQSNETTAATRTSQRRARK